MRKKQWLPSSAARATKASTLFTSTMHRALFSSFKASIASA
jgi:hypothetical protein